MRLEISLKQGEPLGLPLGCYLEATKSLVAGVPREGLRHPLAIHSLSLSETLNAARALLDALAECEPFSGEEAARRVLGSKEVTEFTRRFLLANAEHIDACEKVLGCYFAGNVDVTRRAKIDLRKSLGTYGKHVLVQANHIKHRHSIVRNTVLYGTALASPGYYLESGLGEQLIGPDPIVHWNGASAFSYARELRLFVCGLLFVSRCVRSILERYRGKLVLAEPDENAAFRSVARRVSEFCAIMFPDEVDADYPDVRVSDNKATISIGSIRAPRIPYGDIRFTTQCGGDGMSNTFKLPYFGAGS